MKAGKKATIWLALGNAVSNGGVCMYFGFVVMYLTRHGYSEAWIGFVMMLCAVVNMITQPLFGYLTDTFLPNKQLLIILAAASIPIGFLLPASVSIPVVAAASIILLSVTEQIYGPLFDVWTVRLNERHGGVDYGITRGFGSIGYAVCAMFAGKIFTAIGIQWMFVLHAIMMALLIAVVAMTENVQCDNQKQQSKQQVEENVSLSKAMLILAKNKKYMLFFVSYIFIAIGMRFVGLFYTTLITAKGGTEANLGIGLSIMTLSEFPFMFLYSKYAKHFHVEKLMMFSLGMYTIRNLCMIFAPNLLMLELAQITQGLSFGIFLPAFLFYMQYITPRKITTTAITIVGSAGGAFASVAGTFVGGILIDQIGIYPSMVCCTVLSAIGFVLFLISMAVKPQTEEQVQAVLTHA